MGQFRRISARLLVVAACVLAPLGAAATARAATAQPETSAPPAVVGTTGGVYKAGADVHITGVINGDVHCAGSTVTIDATVHGDVLCAAQHLKLNGMIDGSARIAGQQVDVNARIGHALSVAAQGLHFNSSAHVADDASIFAGTATLDGTIGRDLSMRATTVTLDGVISRDARINATHLTINNSADIEGNLHYWSANTATIAEGTLKGSLQHTQLTKTHASRARGTLFIYALVAGLLFSLLFVWVAPRVLQTVGEQPVNSLGRSLLVGLLAMFLMPVSVVLAGVTVVGLPVAAVLLLCMFLIGCLSLPITGYYLGSMILSKSKNQYAIISLGIALVVVLCSLPAIGGIFLLASFMIGSGSLYLALGQALAKARKPRKNK